MQRSFSFCANVQSIEVIKQGDWSKAAQYSLVIFDWTSFASRQRTVVCLTFVQPVTWRNLGLTPTSENYAIATTVLGLTWTFNYFSKLNKITAFEFSNKFCFLPCFLNIIAPKIWKVIALQIRPHLWHTILGSLLIKQNLFYKHEMQMRLSNRTTFFCVSSSIIWKSTYQN